MPKTRTWRSDLLKYINSIQGKEFTYGEHDCVLFVAGAVAAMTGVDHAQPYRNQYSSVRAGLKLLKDSGYRDQFDFLAKHFHQVPKAFAQVGDIAVINMPMTQEDIDQGVPNTRALGIVQGTGVYLLRNRGLQVVPIKMVAEIHRVE